MKKQLRKPENWQDFESLSKILWGEIWRCPEIKKNGRKGQKQHGVDIYGIPEKETQNFGIQCKGKNDYTNSVLTETEVDEEIQKARNFKPPLKKFYFATTANKDSIIEEYVRLKNDESINSGGFEIHLFSWEDIVDLIDENKRTYDWYMNNIDFKAQHSVKISFKNGDSHLDFNPILLKNHIIYKVRDNSVNKRGLFLPPLTYDNTEDKLKLLTEPQPIRYFFNGVTLNKSSCVFSVLIENDGNIPLEYFKMYITFKGAGLIVDTVDKRTQLLDPIKYSYNTFMYIDSNDCVFEPADQVLVQTDIIMTDEICLRPTIEESQDIVIEYDFVAKDYNKKGILTVRLENTIIEKETVEETFFPRDSETRLENYLE